MELADDHRIELMKFMDDPGFSIVSASELPSCIPFGLRTKCEEAVVILSPTSTGGVYLVFDLHRLDAPARAIDQEPFALIVHSSGPGPSGVLVHHGDWPGRTLTVDQSLWAAVEASGVGRFYLAQLPAGLRRGPLELLPEGDRHAFNEAVRQLRLGVKAGRPV